MGYGLRFCNAVWGHCGAHHFFIQRVEEQISALTIEIVSLQELRSFSTHSVYIWGRHVRLFIYYSGFSPNYSGVLGFQGGSNAVTWGYCFDDRIPNSREAFYSSRSISYNSCRISYLWLIVLAFSGYRDVDWFLGYSAVGCIWKNRIGFSHAIFKLKQHELSSGRFSSVCCWYAELHTNDRRFDRSECACYYY